MFFAIQDTTGSIFTGNTTVHVFSSERKVVLFAPKGAIIIPEADAREYKGIMFIRVSGVWHYEEVPEWFTK